MKYVLLVDDEKPFLLSLSDGLSKFDADFRVITAENGLQAIEHLKALKIHLVITDLKMPEMDGFELLAYMSRKFPTVPVLVMTAFGTPEIESKVMAHGIAHYLEKPLDFNQVVDRIFEVLEKDTGGGYMRGIQLPAFLQLLEAEKKTCTLKIRSHGREGWFAFQSGRPIDAWIGQEHGLQAAYAMVCWEDVEIEMEPLVRPPADVLETTLMGLMMEAFRLDDERKRDGIDELMADIELEEASPETVPAKAEQGNQTREEHVMAVQDKLQELSGIDGFAGVGLFTPTGENLAMLAGSVTNLKEMGVLANAVLLNAQKASLEMGTGRGQVVHIETESGAQVIVRCLNEGTDPLKSQPGKAHIHMVLILKNDSGLGMTKIRANSVCAKLAEDFRM